jgi:hypothetical protein
VVEATGEVVGEKKLLCDMKFVAGAYNEVHPYIIPLPFWNA